MIHHIQLQINDEWRPFFFTGPDLDDSCQHYRDIRAALREAGITHPCRLKRVAVNDQHTILCSHEAHPEIAAVINAFCEIKYRIGKWTSEVIDANDLPLMDE